MGETEFDEEESLGGIAQTQKKNFKTSKVKLESSSASPSASAKAARPATKVKKEEPAEDDDNAPSKSRRASGPIKQAKKETLYDSDDLKPVSARSSSASAKSVKVKESNKKKIVEKVTKKVKVESKADSPAKRERKAYELPGQKRDPPEERDPLRIFYESLYKQIPSSEMAQIWMMESGLLAKEVAQKVLERKQKQKKTSVNVSKKVVSVSKTSLASGGKKVVSAVSKGVSKQIKKRKNVDDSEEDSDDEVLAKRSTKKQRSSGF